MADSTKENLIGLIERMATLESEIGNLSAALAALRLTLAEMGTDFERRYAEKFEAASLREIVRVSSERRELLLAIARKMREQI